MLDMVIKIKYYLECEKMHMQVAAMAQSVERRIGSAEVTGSIPVSSLTF